MTGRLLLMDFNTCRNPRTMLYVIKLLSWGNKLLLIWKLLWWRSHKHGKCQKMNKLPKVSLILTVECSNQVGTRRSIYFQLSRSLQFQTFGHLTQIQGYLQQIGWQDQIPGIQLFQNNMSIYMRKLATILLKKLVPLVGIQLCLEVQCQSLKKFK